MDAGKSSIFLFNVHKIFLILGCLTSVVQKYKFNIDFPCCHSCVFKDAYALICRRGQCCCWRQWRVKNLPKKTNALERGSEEHLIAPMNSHTLLFYCSKIISIRSPRGDASHARYNLMLSFAWLSTKCQLHADGSMCYAHRWRRYGVWRCSLTRPHPCAMCNIHSGLK